MIHPHSGCTTPNGLPNRFKGRHKNLRANTLHVCQAQVSACGHMVVCANGRCAVQVTHNVACLARWMAADLYLREVDVLRFEVRLLASSTHNTLTGWHHDSKAVRGWPWEVGLGWGVLLAVLHDSWGSIAIVAISGGLDSHSLGAGVFLWLRLWLPGACRPPCMDSLHQCTIAMWKVCGVA